MLYHRAAREASMAMSLSRRVAVFALAIFAGIAPSRAAAQATGAVAGVDRQKVVDLPFNGR